MITKLNLNKRRISLSLLSLIVFIANFNLLHSTDNEAESVLAVEPSAPFDSEYNISEENLKAILRR